MTTAAKWAIKARCLLVAAAMLLAALAGQALRGVPAPQTGQEFGHLLSADTFTRHRLINKTPLCWVQLQSAGTQLTPHYASLSAPGPGLVLAASQVLTGVPWWGVVASGVLLAMSCVWMLEAWTAPKWALLGGFLCVAAIGSSELIRGYSVGALPAIGGVFIWGASGRLRHRYRILLGLVYGFGAGLLALSRPLEGSLLVLATALWLTVQAIRNKSLLHLAAAVCLPALVVLAPALEFIAVNNDAVMGTWKALPAWLVTTDPQGLIILLGPLIMALFLGLQRLPTQTYAFLWVAALGWPVLQVAGWFVAPEDIASFAVQRARMESSLTGPSIVLVTYRPGKAGQQEWVYNQAALSDQKVLWTRAIAPFVDRALCHCFPGRQVYRLEADASWPELRALPGFCELTKPLPKRPLR